MIVVVIGLAILVGAGFVAVRLFLGDDATSGPECVVQPDPALSAQTSTTVALADSAAGTPALTSTDALSLSAVQLQYASTVNAVGLRRQISDRGRVIALATALQESSLRNLTTGDRDSVGLFQQRPSQGWGTVAQILDPVFAANAFYDALLDVDEWDTLPLTDAAQAVQQSAHPTAYAKWEPAATTLMGALSYQWYMAVSCRAGAVGPTTEPPEREVLAGSEAAIPVLQQLLSAAAVEVGEVMVVEIAAGGAAATVSVSVPGINPERAAAVLSAWMVAHATGSSVNSVGVSSYLWADHRWTSPTGPVGAALVTVAVSEASVASAPAGGGY